MTSEVENEYISVEFKYEKEVRDGGQIYGKHEILKIKAYIPAIDDWLDVTHMSDFDKAADKLINKEFWGQ